MSAYVIYYQNGAKMMRPVLTREEYMNLRNSAKQQALLKAVREGKTEEKRHLVQMNYSCMPNADGTLKGTKTTSTTVGMDIDHIKPEEMEAVKQRVLNNKVQLGLLMLEVSARGEGYHLVFKRKAEMTQEENLKWASDLLGVKYDEGAKDITRVFFTTTAAELLYLEDEIFRPSKSPLKGDFPTTTTEKDLPASKAESSPFKGDGRGGLSFKGIPYSEIIAEYWKRTGGEPEEGERNVKLHKLAANLRSICDNRQEVLMQVMPRLGLSEQELQGIISSACKEPAKGSKVMDQIVESMTNDNVNGNGNPLNPSTLEPASATSDLNQRSDLNSLRLASKRLPLGLKESLVGVPKPMQMPVLCAVMPIAAAYADQVEVEYCDGTRMKLGLMSIIRGEQASGKSVCKNAVDVWKRQLEEEDALARKREEEWKEKKKARKANEKAPDDPKVLIRTVPVTVSCSTLLKRMKNSRGHTLYSFGEELDTLRKTNGAGSWSSKYDIYRLSFDQGEWGQDYNSDQAESGMVKVAYNWTMLGTNGALRKCFKQDNIENGLSSRMLISEMPDSAFQKMPKYGKRSDLDEQRIQEAVSRLRGCTGFIDTPRLRKAIEKWVEQKRVEAAKDIDRVKDTYRKRAAVIGFRCGVIHYLLTGREGSSTIDFALMMAQYALDQQISAFGEALEKEYVDAKSECQRYGANHSVFDQLPPAFTLDDLAALKRNDLSRQSLLKIILRWKNDGWVEQVDKQHWKKEDNKTLRQ
ncbi:MAG: DUF3987 domain-containing protein [Prevotella sp.]|nr:DUF3987 domain-containing protein [Prevotella sp.]